MPCQGDRATRVGGSERAFELTAPALGSRAHLGQARYPCWLARLRVVAHFAFRAFVSFTPGSSPFVNSIPNRSSASRMRAVWYTVTGGSPSTLSARRTIAECTLARWASLVGGQPSSSRACRIWAPVIIGGETHAS